MAMHGGSLQPSRASAPPFRLPLQAAPSTRSMLTVLSVWIQRTANAPPIDAGQAYEPEGGVTDQRCADHAFDAQTSSGSFGICALSLFLPAERFWDAQPHASSLLVRPPRARTVPSEKKDAEQARAGWCCGCTEDFSCSSPPNQHVPFGRRGHGLCAFCLLPSSAAATCTLLASPIRDRQMAGGSARPPRPPLAPFRGIRAGGTLACSYGALISGHLPDGHARMPYLRNVSTIVRTEEAKMRKIGDEEPSTADEIRFELWRQAASSLGSSCTHRTSSRPTPPTSSSRPPPTSTLRVQPVSPTTTALHHRIFLRIALRIAH